MNIYIRSTQCMPLRRELTLKKAGRIKVREILLVLTSNIAANLKALQRLPLAEWPQVRIGQVNSNLTAGFTVTINNAEL